jgi:hypothetical protein
MRAAKCITPSKAPLRSVDSRRVRSASEPSTRVASVGTAERREWQKLSKTVTLWPEARRIRLTVPPMYPAPPVTRMFIVFPF